MNEEEVQQNIRKPSIQEVQQARIFKQQGNEYFKQKNYEQAIKMYELAIQKNPTSSIYYSNKSRCLFNLGRFQQALIDADFAIKYDEKNIKAHYLAAQSLVQISNSTKDKDKLQKAIQRLKRSLILCPGQGKVQFQRSFIDKIYKAKKKLWLMVNQQEGQKKKALRKYLVHLVQTDKNIDDETKDELNERILKLVENQSNKDFSKIPPALICPITKMLLKQPVCNQYGHSYTKSAYIDYLLKNEGKDPITGKLVKKKQLMYNNLNVKKAVQIFLQEHPWAYDQQVTV